MIMTAVITIMSTASVKTAKTTPTIVVTAGESGSDVVVMPPMCSKTADYTTSNNNVCT